jgi:hypothetical protein
VVYLFLGWGFGVAAVIMTGLTLGRAAVIALVKRYFQWRVGWKWWLAALGLAPAVTLAGVYLNAALAGAPPDFRWRTRSSGRRPTCGCSSYPSS